MTDRRQYQALAFLATSWLAWAQTAAALDCPNEELQARGILERAVARASTVEARRPEARYTFQLRTVTTKHKGDGRIESVEKRLWESVPIGGAPYQRLIAKDDRPLTAKEARKEQDREAKFRRTRAERRGSSKEEDEIRFDRALIDRYQVRLTGCSGALGREAYRIAFEPKRDRVKERRRLDQVLNRVRGEIWIDIETFEIQQVRFALLDGESVRLGPKLLGFLGGLSGLAGRFVRAPVAGGDWLPRELEVDFRGRAFFRSFHLRERTVWEGFAPLLATPTVHSLVQLRGQR